MSDQGQKDLTFPCRLSGRLGRSSVILKDTHKPNIKHITRKITGKRTEGKDTLCQKSHQYQLLEKKFKSMW